MACQKPLSSFLSSSSLKTFVLTWFYSLGLLHHWFEHLQMKKMILIFPSKDDREAKLNRDNIFCLFVLFFKNIFFSYFFSHNWARNLLPKINITGLLIQTERILHSLIYFNFNPTTSPDVVLCELVKWANHAFYFRIPLGTWNKTDLMNEKFVFWDWESEKT